MKHNFDNSAIAKLDAIAKETQEILEYNDENICISIIIMAYI